VCVYMYVYVCERVCVRACICEQRMTNLVSRDGSNINRCVCVCVCVRVCI